MAIRSNPFRVVHHSRCNPRDGAEVAAAVSMTLAILSAYGAFQQLLQWGNKMTLHPENEPYPGELEGRLILLFIPILYFATCCCLIHGIKKEVRWYLLPYIVANIMATITFLVALVTSRPLLNFLMANSAMALLIIAAILVVFYLTLVVLSYFCDIQIRSSPSSTRLLLPLSQQQQQQQDNSINSVTGVAKSIAGFSEDVV